MVRNDAPGAHPNAALLGKMNAAFAAHDADGVRACFAPDAVWNVPGSNAVAGSYRGPDEILEFFARLDHETGGTLHVETIAEFASDWGAVELIRTTGVRRGQSCDNVELIAYEMVDGKITNVIHRPDQVAADVFFAMAA